MISVPVIDAKGTGERIYELLDRAGMSVKDLQDEMGFTTGNAIYKWFHGKNIPSLDNLVILSAVLNVPIDEIIVVRYSA